MFKVNKKVQAQTLESGFSVKEKLNSFPPKPIYTCCGPKQSHCAIAMLGRDIAKVRERNLESLSE